MRFTARFASAALVAVGAGGILTSCDVGPSHTLHSGSVEAQIAAQLRTRYPVGNATVSCPNGIPARVGTTFTCMASFYGEHVQLQGLVTSPGGRYSISPAEAIVSTAQATQTLERDLATDLHTQVTVDCGSPAVRVVPVNGQFGCTASVSGQGQRQVTVTVEDLQGHFRYSVAAPQSAPS